MKDRFYNPRDRTQRQKGKGMKQKYTIHKDTDNKRLIIKEYAELDKEILSLLCEESYDDAWVTSAIQNGTASPHQCIADTQHVSTERHCQQDCRRGGVSL